MPARGSSSRYCVPNRPIEDLPRAEQVDELVADQRLEQAVAGADEHQIVMRARLAERGETHVMHVGLARQQRIDHVAGEPAAEAGAVRHHRHAA